MGLDKEECERRFREVTEAYENLMDARKRRLYEERGSEGVCFSGAQAFFAAFAAGLGDGPPAKRVHAFFDSPGTPSAWAGFSACSASFQKAFGEELRMPGGLFEKKKENHSTVKAKDAPIEVSLPCTLEELYQGTTKRMRIDRTVLGGADGLSRVPKSEVVSVRILPGWPAGTRITYSERGDEHPGRIAADIVFVLTEQPHKLYTRRGRDLEYTCRLSLTDALCGCEVTMPSLDGRDLSLHCNGIVTSGSERRIRGEGMPSGLEKGDLVVRFDVEFPTELDREAKDAIRKALSRCVTASSSNSGLDKEETSLVAAL